MIEICSCCGYRGDTSDTSNWARDGAKRPDIFICDVCRLEWLK